MRRCEALNRPDVICVCPRALQSEFARSLSLSAWLVSPERRSGNAAAFSARCRFAACCTRHRMGEGSCACSPVRSLPLGMTAHRKAPRRDACVLSRVWTQSLPTQRHSHRRCLPPRWCDAASLTGLAHAVLPVSAEVLTGLVADTVARLTGVPRGALVCVCVCSQDTHVVVLQWTSQGACVMQHRLNATPQHLHDQLHGCAASHIL